MKKTFDLGNGPRARTILAGIGREVPLGRLEAWLQGMGFRITLETIKPSNTDEQRRGFHWLLKQWLKLDPGIAKDEEALKEKLCKATFGVAKVYDEHGNEYLKAAVRTTRVWDHATCEYRAKQMTRDQYTQLIESVYRLGPSELPEMEKHP